MKFKVENKVLEKALKRFTPNKSGFVPPVEITTTKAGLMLKNPTCTIAWNISCLMIPEANCFDCNEAAYVDLCDLLRLSKLGGYAEYEARYGDGDSAGELCVSVSAGGKNKTAAVILRERGEFYTRARTDAEIGEKNPEQAVCNYVEADAPCGFVYNDPDIAFTVPAADAGKFLDYLSNCTKLVSDNPSSGILLKEKFGNLRVSAYDSALLSVWDTQFKCAPDMFPENGFRADDVAAMLKLAGNTTDEIRCRIGGSRIVFESATWCYDCNHDPRPHLNVDSILANGKFEQRKSFEVSASDVLANTKELDAALKTDKSGKPILLSGGGNTLCMSIHTPRYTQENTIETRGDDISEDMYVYMNPAILTAGFRMFDSDDVTVRYGSAVDGLYAKADDIAVFMLPVSPSTVRD